MVGAMFEADVAEFPFTSELPKRQRTRLQSLWDQLSEIRAVVESKGMLIPASMAAKVLGVSRQRVHDLIKEGRLENVEMNGHNFITEASVVDYAKSERKAGRPVKGVQTAREVWAASRESTAELAGKK